MGVLHIFQKNIANIPQDVQPSRRLHRREGPSNFTLNKIMGLSIGGFLGMLICILTIHYFIRRSKRKKMGLPPRNKRRKATLAELEAYLPPPDLDAVAAQMGPRWRRENAALRPAASGVLSPNREVQEPVTSPIKLETRTSANRETYDFTQSGQRRVEIIPQRPARPERTDTPEETNDFRSILVPSPLPSPNLAPPPAAAVRMNPRGYSGGSSPHQPLYSPIPSPSIHRPPTGPPRLPHEPPLIKPKSPLRNQHVFAFPPRSPPPSSPPPPIPAFPQATTNPDPLAPRASSANNPSPCANRSENSFQELHHYRQSISSTIGSTSDRPSDDAGPNPALIRDSERTAAAQLHSHPDSIKRKNSKRLQKNQHGHRRTKTQDESISMSNMSVGDGLRRTNTSPEAKEGDRTKASSMILQLASGWDPDSSSEDAESRGGKKKKKKGKGKDKEKEKEGKQGRGRKASMAADRG